LISFHRAVGKPVGHTMLDEAQRRLRALVAEQGPSVVDDRQRCQNLIRDYGLTDRGSVNILIAALEENIPADLRKPDAVGTLDLLMANLRGRLQTNHGQTEDASRWAVESWAVALGLLEDAHARAPIADADGPPRDVSSQTARPRLSHPVVRWTVSAMAITVTIIAYSAAAIRLDAETAAETARSAGLVQNMRKQVDIRSIFPKPTLTFATESHITRNKSGDTLTISVNIDGTKGSASGTLKSESGIISNISFDLNLFRIITTIKEKKNSYVLRPPDSSGTSITIAVDNSGKYTLDEICLGASISGTRGCFR
jgi:hypothetical protein